MICDNATCDDEAAMRLAVDGEKKAYCTEHSESVENRYPGEVVVLGPIPEFEG